MKSSDISKFNEIKLISDTINSVKDITFADNTKRDAFIANAKIKLEKLLISINAD